MADYELSTLNVDGTDIDIADSTARQNITTTDSNLMDEITNRENADTRIENQLNTTLNNTETKLKQQTYRNIICVGDSWAAGYEATNGWCYYLNNMIETDYFNAIYYGGSGFVATGTDSTDKTYLDLLRSIEGNVANKSAIDCIIVAGNTNDLGLTGTQQAVQNFITYALQTYPSAVIYNISCNCLVYGNEPDKYKSWIGYSNITNPRYRYIDIHWIVPASQYNSSLHCTDAGYKTVATAIKNIINGCEPVSPPDTNTQTYTMTLNGSNTDISPILTQSTVNGYGSISIPAIRATGNFSASGDSSFGTFVMFANGGYNKLNLRIGSTLYAPAKVTYADGTLAFTMATLAVTPTGIVGHWIEPGTDYGTKGVTDLYIQNVELPVINRNW